MLKWSALAALLMAATAAGIQQAGITDPATRDICASMSQVDLPAADRPDAADRAALAGCVSVDLYFGFGMAPDPVRARKCAYLEMERGSREPVFGGRGLLMMVYANGKGAARNFDVAIKLACAIGGAPQDIAGRVRQLALLRAGRWTGDSFSICDHSSGPELYDQCANLQERFDQVARAKRMTALSAKWSVTDRKAFETFRKTADRFFEVHAAKEANLAATHEVQERAAQEDWLVAALERFEQGDLPSLSAAEERQAETDMNALYLATQQGKTRTWGTATAEGIKQAQQLWLPYRDAWVAFAAARYKTVGTAGWKAWLTTERVGMLSKFPQLGG